MTTKSIGTISFEINGDFDFSFLADFGETFIVFDKQDSGYLHFGVQDADKKYFLKMAGASTVRSSITNEQAIENLRSSIIVHNTLCHPKLTKLITHMKIDKGYLLIFEWINGKNLWKYGDSYNRFLNLPNVKKLAVYQDILQFHKHVNKKDYIAIDFYDGNIMYDFDNDETMFFDVDSYKIKPIINNIGQMRGSPRYMSPEEFELGAEIDERSNVFCMGATAFNLFGGETDRSIEKWSISKDLYKVAAKAINQNKENRYQSIGEYIEAWNSAL